MSQDRNIYVPKKIIATEDEKSSIINVIKDLVPPGSPEPIDTALLYELQLLTEQLIQVYKASGQLQSNPFLDVHARKIYCYDKEVRSRLQGKTALVTGGEGCVGTYLSRKLELLGANKIVSVDFARLRDEKANRSPVLRGNKIFYAVDIRDFESLDKIFACENPDFVFHLAALRVPGIAELEVRETIETNVFGSQNIIDLCEKYSVKKCIFSSTGKASRYVTAEVYAATKKIAEWLFTQASQEGTTIYGLVRFTHMLENSAVCDYYDRRVAQGKIVSIHAPNKYICGQNANEAVNLLLNSLAIAQPKQAEFIVCSNLGWPVETLEIALHKILESGKRIPIYFQGSPAGYSEAFFRGQFDWDHPTEANLLINTVENAYSRVDDSGDFIVTPVLSFKSEILEAELVKVEALLKDPEAPDSFIKKALAECVKTVSSSIYSQASTELLLKILNWGIDPDYLALDGINLDAHGNTIRLLVESLLSKQSEIY